MINTFRHKVLQRYFEPGSKAGIQAAHAVRLRLQLADLDQAIHPDYREAGDASAPTVLLLHGFPTSSHMFRNLIPRLADRYHVVAPDYPG